MDLKFLTAKEVAEMIGVHVRTIHVYIREGKLKAYKTSKLGDYRILKENVIKFLENNV
jgi:excisionase family DNA binding protein